MNKTFKTLSAAATLSAALLLGSCDNAAENQKLMDEDKAKVQTVVDEKMTALQAEADAACAAQVDTLANAAYTAWVAENTKGGKFKKPAAKPAPKPAAKAEEPKGATNPFEKASGQSTGQKATNPFQKATGTEAKPAPKATNPFENATKPK